MPNHCVNRLSVVGPADQVTSFIKVSTQRKPNTGDPEGSINYFNDRESKPTAFAVAERVQ